MGTVVEYFLLLDNNLQITSHYGERIINGKPDFHNGTDIAHLGGSPTGFPTPVPSHSTITKVGYNPGGWGNYVRFKQTGADYEIQVAHLDTVDVTEEQTVIKGQSIGGMGNTGNSFGNHWHIEVWVEGERVNPETYPLYGSVLPGNNDFTVRDLQQMLNACNIKDDKGCKLIVNGIIDQRTNQAIKRAQSLINFILGG